jgi:small subunit ribosomal protein S1
LASKSKKSAKPKSSGSSKKGKSVMEALMDKIDSKSVGLSVADKVSGKVIRIEKHRVVIDIGGKSEGIVAEKAFREAEDFIKTLEAGDKVQATVLVPETPDGFTILSLRHAARDAAWKKLEEAEKKGEPVVVQGRNLTSAGIIVDVFGMTGFIPNSQLGREVSKDKDGLVNDVFKVKIIDLARDENKIVLSEKEISEAEDIRLAKEAMDKVKIGEQFKGEVTTIYDFGCFVKIKVDLGKKKGKVPIEGLVHISELSWGKVDNPHNIVKEGDKVDVAVIDKKDNKLALSIKETTKDPWEGVERKYKKDKKVKGRVVKMSDFGAFIQLEPGVEGLLHMTKIPPGRELSEGDDVEVYIEEVDEKARRISLGLVLMRKPVGYK